MAKRQTVTTAKPRLLSAMIIRIMDCLGELVSAYDRLADLLSWTLSVSVINTLRKVHDLRIGLLKYKRQAIGGVLYFAIAGIVMVWMIAGAVDYSYSYNGKELGIVKEQRDVLEIMDLVSDELSRSYQSPVAINAEEDISFKPVISYGKQIDAADDVLTKFTYMGDIQTVAYGFFVNGKRVATIQSEKEGQAVIDSIIEKYLTKKKKEYEYYGLVENVEIKEVDTVLSKVNSRQAAVRTIEAGAINETIYKAKKGETFKDVAEKLDVSVRSLKELNPSIKDEKAFKKGQKIVSQKTEQILNVKTISKETFAEVVPYETETIKSDDYFEGEEFVKVNGQDGKQAVTARITRINGEISEREDLKTEMIRKPINKVVVKGTRKQPPRQGTGTYIRPVEGKILYGFGNRIHPITGRRKFHDGIDIPCAYGTPIKASDGGTVIRAGWYSGYGLCVDIDHGAGMVTRYGHNSSLLVSVGDKVYQGQIIAKAGSTGNSTGPHCHFEVLKNGVPVDPTNYTG